MMTEAFSGARAPITHIGDHISGLLPECQVVPTTTFNLVAVGPYLDDHPRTAIVMTARTALQLTSVDFEEVAHAPDPRSNLVSQLEAKDPSCNYRVSVTVVGTRDGPGSLYNTDLFDSPSTSVVRDKLINSARTGVPCDITKLPNLSKYLAPADTITNHSSTPKPRLARSALQHHATTPTTTTTTPKHAKAWVSSTSYNRKSLD